MPKQTISFCNWAKRGLPVIAVIFIMCMAHPADAQLASEVSHRVSFEARLTSTDQSIEDGLEWRIFHTNIDEKGELPLLATANGGTKSFDMSVGEYYVHVAYGFAGAMRRVKINKGENQQVFILNAGGLQLEAITSPDGPISSSLLRFDVFRARPMIVVFAH